MYSNKKIKMEKTKEEKLALLNETVKYYSKDVNRRCKARINGNIKCSYSADTLTIPNSDGCAVGRLLSPKLRLELDNKYVEELAGIEDVWDNIPQDIQDYGLRLLGQLQKLHDRDEYWSNNGLSSDGKLYVKQIKEELV